MTPEERTILLHAISEGNQQGAVEGAYDSFIQKLNNYRPPKGARYSNLNREIGVDWLPDVLRTLDFLPEERALLEQLLAEETL